MAGRPLAQVWDRYVSVFRAGVQTEVSKETPLWDKPQDKARKLKSIPKGAVVHVKPVDAPRPVTFLEVVYCETSCGDPFEGWVRVTNLKKPATRPTGGQKFNMKPQDFPSLPLDTNLSYTAYIAALKGAVESRVELPTVVKTFLVELIEYCNSHSTGDRADLVTAYRNLTDSAYEATVGNIQKDFSELIAPICVLERGGPQLTRLGFSDLNKGNAQIFLPGAGNEPLIDFKIFDGNAREYPFSVKVLSNTTNVIKPQDLVAFMDANARDSFMQQYENKIEGKILRVMGNTRKGVAETSYEAIRLLAQQSAHASKFPSNILKAIPADASPSSMTDAHMQRYASVWADMSTRYYAKFNEDNQFNASNLGGSGKANARYNQVSLIMQLAIQKFSDDGHLQYREIVVDYLMNKVTYYKFRLTGNGMPEFKMENKAYNQLKPSDKFKLRAKSYKTSPVNDRVGIQP